MSEKRVMKLQNRLLHIDGHLSTMFDIAIMSKKIFDRSDNSLSLLLRFNSFFLAKAMVVWFKEKDIFLMKKYSYCGSIIVKIFHLLKTMENKPNLTYSPGPLFSELLLPLISDNEDVINWLTYDDALFDLVAAENPKKDHFWVYQTRLALRGEWERLRERCHKVMANPPKSAWHAKYVSDSRFYLALADGAIGRMEHFLEEITSSNIIRIRQNVESGFTQDLISTDAVIYAKIAWRHGYQVRVDSPYVPAEWLPVSPLSLYECSLPFVEGLNVDTVEEFSQAWLSRLVL